MFTLVLRNGRKSQLLNLTNLVIVSIGYIDVGHVTSDSFWIEQDSGLLTGMK